MTGRAAAGRPLLRPHRVAAALLIAASLIAAGCGGEREASPSPGDFFATAPGTTWRYLGRGNEFATYSAEITHRQGSLVQIVVHSGADVASVYEVTPERVVRRLRSGELEEANRSLLGEPFVEEYVVIEGPLEVGHSWEAAAEFPIGRQTERRRIEGVGLTVETPAGTFEHVLQVRVSYPSGVDALEYYAPGVGLVRSEYLSEEPVISELESFTPEDAGDRG